MTPSPPVSSRPAAWPVAVLLFSSSLWGLSWWPLKQFVAMGLSGPALSLLAYGLVSLCTFMLLWRWRWWAAGPIRLLSAR